MRILFMGTPDFALPSLQALLDAGHELVGVFTRADKPKNRGMKLQAPPVKMLAEEHQIPVYQPTTLRDGTALAQIESLAPDLIVVVAYGRILPLEILDYPKYGCINVHSSLLPKYRGSAPIHWAMLNGDAETGVTIMHMAEALDAGDIIAQDSTPIDGEEVVGDLHDRLAVMGAKLLVKVVEDLQAGTATRTVQDENLVTLAPMLGRHLSTLDFSKPAQMLHNQVRGLNPWPSATAELAGKTCKIWKTQVLPQRTDAEAGTVLSADKMGIVLACGGGTCLNILDLQATGKRRMHADDFLRGNPIVAGTRL